MSFLTIASPLLHGSIRVVTVAATGTKLRQYHTVPSLALRKTRTKHLFALFNSKTWHWYHCRKRSPNQGAESAALAKSRLYVLKATCREPVVSRRKQRTPRPHHPQRCGCTGWRQIVLGVIQKPVCSLASRARPCLHVVSVYPRYTHVTQPRYSQQPYLHWHCIRFSSCVLAYTS